MRIVSFIPLSLPLALSIAASSGSAQTPPASVDSARIAALEQRIENAVAHRDAAFLDSVYAPTFRFKHATGQLEDRSQRMRAVQGAPPANAARFTERVVDSLEVEVHGDVALTTGRIHVRRDGPASPTRDYTIRYARIYVRSNRGWQLLTHHSTHQTYDAATR